MQSKVDIEAGIEQVSRQMKGKTMESQEITNADIAAYVEDMDDPAIRRRVVAAAIVDKNVRERINLLKLADAPNALFVSDDFDDRALQLQANMLKISHEISQKNLIRTEMGAIKAVNGGLWAVAEKVQNAISYLLRESAYFVTISRESLTLPCLAPAAAASGSDLDLHRNTILTPDGVRIEFQQTPGIGRRIRLIVDAASRNRNQELPYDTAFVTIEESVPEEQKSKQHILIVGLNQEGRGLTDMVITSGTHLGTNEMPAPRGSCSVVGVTLLRVRDLMQTGNLTAN